MWEKKSIYNYTDNSTVCACIIIINIIIIIGIIYYMKYNTSGICISVKRNVILLGVLMAATQYSTMYG